MAKRKKPKIKVKRVHSMSLHEHITNPIPIKNKESKIKKKKINLKNKKKCDYEKVLRFKKEIDFSEDELLNDEENENEANAFLDFDDDINIEEQEEQSDNDEQLFQKNSKNLVDETNENNDIFKEYDIPIETEINKTKNNSLEKTEQGDKTLTIVEKCYKIIGEQLAIYTSGKIHSAFIILTRSPKWHEYILLTKPENWSKYATFEATKIFSTGLKMTEVPKFYEFILLPKILKHIEQHKKLDGILYQSLIKALYKPIAWFKGILFPLIQKECSNKVMVIVGSIIKRMSINVKYVMMGIRLMFTLKEENSVFFYFLCIFLDKKYKFTKEFIIDCINYFLKFSTCKKALPLMWHKSLHFLVLNYKDLINDEHRKSLQDLVTKKHHHKISVEILKNLFSTSVIINKIKNWTDSSQIAVSSFV